MICVPGHALMGHLVFEQAAHIESILHDLAPPAAPKGPEGGDEASDEADGDETDGDE